MILADYQIQKEIESGRLLVDPFDSSLINPASLDIRLGDKFGYIKRNREQEYISYGLDGSWVEKFPQINPLNKDSFSTVWQDGFGGGKVIRPKEFVLTVSMETIGLPDDIAAVLMGKSSLGRLGLMQSSVAGLGDPGFKGKYVLEMYNYSDEPIKLTTGMKIGQLVFHRTKRVAKSYKETGRYQDQAHEGSKGV